MTDRRDDETKKQMQVPVFPRPERKQPLSQKDFIHTHEWEDAGNGQRRCRTCGVVL